MASERTTAIIADRTQDINNKYNAGMAFIQTLTTMFQQYKSIVDDLLTAKQRYVELVLKYTSAQPQYSTPSSLPGLVSSSPISMLPDMQADSAEIRQLAALLNELEDQRALVYTQLRKSLEQIIGITSDVVDTASKIDMLLNNMIDKSNGSGVYGDSRVNQRAAALL
jgi:hypothetical protein